MKYKSTHHLKVKCNFLDQQMLQVKDHPIYTTILLKIQKLDRLRKYKKKISPGVKKIQGVNFC